MFFSTPQGTNSNGSYTTLNALKHLFVFELQFFLAGSFCGHRIFKVFIKLRNNFKDCSSTVLSNNSKWNPMISLRQFQLSARLVLCWGHFLFQRQSVLFLDSISWDTEYLGILGTLVPTIQASTIWPLLKSERFAIMGYK